MKYLGVAVLLSFSLILLGLQKPLDEPIYEYGMLTCVQDGLAFATFSFDLVATFSFNHMVDNIPKAEQRIPRSVSHVISVHIFAQKSSKHF